MCGVYTMPTIGMFHRHFGVNNVGIDFAGDHFVFCLARFGMTPNITAFTAYWTNNPYSSRNHSFSHLYSLLR
jgi:hypothetical protein